MRYASPAALQRLLGLLRKKPQHEHALGRSFLEELSTFRPSAETPFDVLVAPDDAVWEDLFPNALLLNRSTLSNLFSGLTEVGSLPAHKGGRIAQSTAKRVANRLAAKVSVANPAKQSAFSKAWLFPIWRELATLLPVRALARKIVQSYPEKLVVVPLSTNIFSYLNYFRWDAQGDEIEPLLLAAACRRVGLDVIVVAHESAFVPGTRSAKEITLEIRPYAIWNEFGSPILYKGEKDTLVVEDGIRNFGYAKSQIPDAATIKSRLYSGSEQANIVLWGEEHNPPVHTVSLRLVGDLADRMALYSPISEIGALSDQFIASMLPMTEVALETAIGSVHGSNIKDVHICDCYFFESALVAHAVRQNGGRVHLWPHSINDTFIHQHARSDCPTTIRSITSTSARKCAEYFPTSKIIADPRIMLSPPRPPRPFVHGRPTSVIIFGGSHAVARMPLMNLGHHKQTWIKLLKSLASYPDDFRVLFKPKGHWESPKWLSSLSSDPLGFEETSLHANHLDFENSVFMSVTLASAALMEGLGRGIPFMIARETSVEDYMFIDPEVVPVGSADFIIDELLKLRDPQKFRSFTERQLHWYSQEALFYKSAHGWETTNAP
ncbi:hypothetical protein [Agrobacterium pusense]|uniref:hypothetical protein n=1 Tax=Agrobacterium pusense TaxID=648995 RepID=UPI0024157A63|nr:hypothetical protein [Agrobacterium pusense]WFN89126.1 hypothetical protein P9K39_22295 [Agrobacterium pusense]